MAGKISNLTGVWLGLYSYPRLLQPASFTATLIETESWISGSTHEASHYDGETLLATLIGSRDGNAVSFVKTYEQVNRGYGPPVRYEGHVSEDGTEIEGRWTIRADWAGKFLMVRSGGGAEARARKKFAEV